LLIVSYLERGGKGIGEKIGKEEKERKRRKGIRDKDTSEIIPRRISTRLFNLISNAQLLFSKGLWRWLIHFPVRILCWTLSIV
jgi:hypothetical protein